MLASKFETIYHLIWHLFSKYQIKWESVWNFCGLFRMFFCKGRCCLLLFLYQQDPWNIVITDLDTDHIRCISLFWKKFHWNDKMNLFWINLVTLNTVSRREKVSQINFCFGLTESGYVWDLGSRDQIIFPLYDPFRVINI